MSIVPVLPQGPGRSSHDPCGICVLAVALLAAGCSARATPRLAAPGPEADRVQAVAETAPRAGGVQPIALAVSSGMPTPLRLEPTQVYAHLGNGDDPRVMPLPPSEAARLAGGADAPGRLTSAAKGTVVGSAVGAASGAVWGAIFSGAAGAGAAAGAAAGAVGGVLSGLIFGGGGSSADVAGFTDRGLPAAMLEQGMSQTGYVYFPAGPAYQTLEVLLGKGDGTSERLLVPVAPTGSTS